MYSLLAEAYMYAEDRLPRKAYLMLYNLDARDKRNWASNVRMQLFQYGFGSVWMNQGVEE